MSFTAEATNTGGELFATFKVNASSLHYPLGVIVWGADSGSLTETDTNSPFPVRLYGNSTTNPIGVDQIGYVAPSTTVTITGYVAPSTTVTVSANAITAITTAVGGGALDSTNSAIRVNIVTGNDTIFTQTGYVAPSTTFTQTGYVAPSTTVTITGNSSTTPLFVTAPGGDTAHAMVVRGPTDSAVLVRQTLGNSSSTPMFVTAPGGDTAHAMVVRGPTDSAVLVRQTLGNSSSTPMFVTAPGGDTAHAMVVRGPVDSAVLTRFAVGTAAAGAAESTQLALSSLALTVGGMTAVGRLYGMSLSNPSTAADVWVKVFKDDSAGVTLGTTLPMMNVMVPFGGGREMNFGPAGLAASSGLSVATAASAASSAHDAPGATIEGTFYYAPST